MGLVLELEESAANTVLEEGPGDGSEDGNQSDGEEDRGSFMLLVVFRASFGASVTDVNQHDRNQHQAEVFHCEEAKHASFHHSFGVTGELGEPAPSVIKDQAKKKLGVHGDHGEQVQLLVASGPWLLASPTKKTLHGCKCQQDQNYPAKPGVKVQKSSMHRNLPMLSIWVHFVRRREREHDTLFWFENQRRRSSNNSPAKRRKASGEEGVGVEC